MQQPQPLPQIPSPCRRSCGANSPEFEFWMVGNPSFPEQNLLSADELFSGGFLLPLHLLRLPPAPPQPTGPDKPPEPEPEPGPSTLEPAELSPNSNSNSNSKRWRHIFKKKLDSSISSSTRPEDESNKLEKREKKNGGAVGFGAGNVVSAAELNINIWPFSRSRSAGNGGARPRAAATTRKVSSAPCSRSNSTGESKSRKLPPHSPNRAAGVHLGRNSPVWQLRRGGGRSSDGANEGHRKLKATGLSLKVPTCIGYRSYLGVAAAGRGRSEIEGEVSGEVVPRSNLFKIRSLFTKKVH